MWALVDCNTFFALVERVFHPGLKHKPVVVLSNNDGCIVALTSEAKALGLHRGDPIFKVKSIVEANHVAVFSTNMQLYSAMSDRITSILRQSVMHVEKYSIDESFCDLQGYENDEKRRKALELFPLDDVWGIGRKTFEKLTYYGVRTPHEFADKTESWVRSHFSKPGLQTWLELNGVPCIDTSEVARRSALGSIYVPGIMYKMSGVVVSDICDAGTIQGNYLTDIREILTVQV